MTSHLSEFIQGRSDYERVYRAFDSLLDAAITFVAEADHPASSLGNISTHVEVRELREMVNAAMVVMREAPYGGMNIPRGIPQREARSWWRKVVAKWLGQTARK